MAIIKLDADKLQVAINFLGEALRDKPMTLSTINDAIRQSIVEDNAEAPKPKGK